MQTNAASRSPASLMGFIALVALHVICGLVVLFVLLRSIPQYEKIFKDFGTRLPDVTLLVLQLSHFVGWYWYLLIPVALVGDVAILFVCHRTSHPWLMAAWGIFVLLAAMLFVALAHLAVSMPFFSLMSRLSEH
jgi:type II secretory pathway component PulF